MTGRSHQHRRSQEPRIPATEQVEFNHGERRFLGWTLNISSGGLRAIIDEDVAVGDELKVSREGAGNQVGWVVWVKKAKGGSVVGISFEARGVDSVPGKDEPASLAGETTPLTPESNPSAKDASEAAGSPSPEPSAEPTAPDEDPAISPEAATTDNCGKDGG